MKILDNRKIRVLLVVCLLATMVFWGIQAFSAPQCDGIAFLTWDEERLECIDPWTHDPGLKVDCKLCVFCNCFYRCCTA